MSKLREYQIRPCSVLTFDEDKEKDLINIVNNLKDRKKLGIFITNLIRIALESPEVYGTRNEVNQVLAKIDELGITPCRYTYFSQLSKEVNDIKKKVDSIYNMAYKTYMLAQMGKHLGLEDKSTNLMLASFILERQVTELCKNIGVDNLNHTFASNKLADTKIKADEVMEFIIESYDSLVDELKKSLTSDGIVMVAQGQVPSVAQSNQSQQISVDQGKPIVNATDNSSNTSSSSGEDKPVGESKEDDASEFEGGAISTPTGERAEMLKRMMQKKNKSGG